MNVESLVILPAIVGTRTKTETLKVKEISEESLIQKAVTLLKVNPAKMTKLTRKMICHGVLLQANLNPTIQNGY
jgi:hypothetical protein